MSGPYGYTGVIGKTLYRDGDRVKLDIKGFKEPVYIARDDMSFASWLIAIQAGGGLFKIRTTALRKLESSAA